MYFHGIAEAQRSDLFVIKGEILGGIDLILLKMNILQTMMYAIH